MLDSLYGGLIGAAGSGKSYILGQRCQADPRYALRAATTGIAAVNISGVTINSLFNYFDTQDLFNKIRRDPEQFYNRLKKIAQNYDRIAIDEAFMMSGAQLDLWSYVTNEYNRRYPKKPVGLFLTGDPAQLPVVGKEPATFQAQYWKWFQPNVEILTGNQRQSDPEFIAALSQLRLGRAEECVDFFGSKVGFCAKVDDSFPGTTILSTNNAVNTYNSARLSRIPTQPRRYDRMVKGDFFSQWREIPEMLFLKIGCPVILTRNNLEAGYANGDQAQILDMYEKGILVELFRNGKQVVIDYTTQEAKTPSGRKGTVTYLPVKLAWAATIHKLQGLTLDLVQARITDSFIRSLSGGLYVLLSRCKTLEGLRIVGNRDAFIQNCYLHADYLAFIHSLAHLEPAAAA